MYPSYRLEDFTRRAPPKGRRRGWAIGLETTDPDGNRKFEIYVYVTLEINEEGEPVQLLCSDDAGRTETTPKGDLSRDALVAALKRLHLKKEGQAWQVWRWLGYLSDAYGVGDQAG